jgi:hypothetical protein
LQPFGSLKAFFATDKKRPDGMTTFPYKALQGGKTIGVGFHCSRYCVQPTVTHQLKNLAKTAENAELRKIHDYRHLTDFHFIPIGAEILGQSNSLKTLGTKSVTSMAIQGRKASVWIYDRVWKTI